MERDLLYCWSRYLLLRCVYCCWIFTFIMVELHTGTNFPAVSLNSLLAAAMMKHTERWNGTGAPTQSVPQAASFALSACNNYGSRSKLQLQVMSILTMAAKYTLWFKLILQVNTKHWLPYAKFRELISLQRSSCVTAVLWLVWWQVFWEINKRSGSTNICNKVCLCHKQK